MAVYTDTRLYTDPPNVHLTELTLYGTGRLGLVNNITENISPYVYELTDHIGNVRATVLSVKVSGAVEVLSYTDYYPHGSVMPGRHYESSNGYRYDFQGIEKDAELNWNNFELRMYDANLGRWMSPDPYREFHSPYLAMDNDPINRIDPDGGRSMDIASTEPVVYEDYGRNQVDPFDMVGGGGWSEENYQWVDGKLISLEDDPYSPYTLEEQVLGRISASKGVSPPSNSNRSNTDFTVTGIMLPEVNVVDGKIANKNEIVNAVNTFQSGLDNVQSGGRVTFETARFWFLFGSGTPMNVNLNTINFSRVSMRDMKGKMIKVQLDNPFKHMTNMNDALVYGTMYLYQVNGNLFKAAYVPEINGNGDKYDFDVKWTSTEAWYSGRNPFTIFGGSINSLYSSGANILFIKGTSYPIYLHGTVKINP